MSTLVIQPIDSSGVIQNFKITEDVNLYRIRIGLYKKNTPTGNLVISLLYGSDIILSKVIPMTTLNSEFTKNYGYGIFSFDFEIPLKKVGVSTEYSIKLQNTSGTLDNYYAWFKNWIPDLTNTYGDYSSGGSVSNDTSKPYHLELYKYK